MSVRSYNPAVRVGNWQEDIAMQEVAARCGRALTVQEIQAEFQRRRERGEISEDGVGAVLSSASLTHVLSKSDDGFVRFGDSVMIVNDGAAREVALVANSFSAATDVLSVAASKDGAPKMRNVFTIAPAGAAMEPGAVLRYGDQFCLVAKDPFGQERHLHSERVTLYTGMSTISGKQAVSLVHAAGKPSHNDAWVIIALNPAMRLESEGLEVPANTPLIIRHVASNVNLAVLSDHAVRSQLGVEPEVVCATILDHKVETAANVWSFVMEH